MGCANDILFIRISKTHEIYIMLIIYLYMLFYLPLVLRRKFCEATVNEGLAKVLLGGYTNVRTIQLLNQLCNDSQDADDTVARDACYGCFFRASNRPSGYPMLLSMSACADAYLNGSDYGHCSTYLKNATSNAETRATPTIIYCTFLECIRQVNKDSLEALVSLRNGKKIVGINRTREFKKTKYVFARRGICIVRNTGGRSTTTAGPGTGDIDPRDGIMKLNTPRDLIQKNIYQFFVHDIIRQCVKEALKMIPDFSIDEIPLAQLFVNTTACILAKTRCGALNPITGTTQEHLDFSKLPIPSINAILVNSNYDMNIVQLPFIQGAIDDCAKYRNVQQASWPSVECSNGWNSLSMFEKSLNGNELVYIHLSSMGFLFIQTPSMRVTNVA